MGPLHGSDSGDAYARPAELRLQQWLSWEGAPGPRLGWDVPLLFVWDDECFGQEMWMSCRMVRVDLSRLFLCSHSLLQGIATPRVSVRTGLSIGTSAGREDWLDVTRLTGMVGGGRVSNDTCSQLSSE